MSTPRYDAASVDVLITPNAQGQFERLPTAIKLRVRDVFTRLSRWPVVSGAKPLTGDLVGRYRIRTGDYRVQFFVHAQGIVVEKIGHRDRFYG